MCNSGESVECKKGVYFPFLCFFPVCFFPFFLKKINNTRHRIILIKIWDNLSNCFAKNVSSPKQTDCLAAGVAANMNNPIDAEGWVLPRNGSSDHTWRTIAGSRDVLRLTTTGSLLTIENNGYTCQQICSWSTCAQKHYQPQQSHRHDNDSMRMILMTIQRG